MIKEYGRQLEATVKELMFGTALFGILVYLILVWFISDKLGFTLGWFLGVAAAVLLSLHMNYSIRQSLEMQEQDAKGYMQRMSVLRTGIILVLLGLSKLLGVGSPVAVIGGLLMLKFGAYFQPCLHRLMQKKEKGR